MNIVARIKNILLSPVKEWGVIDGESASIGSLYTGYAIPLALIPAVAGFIGNSFVGMSVMGMAIKTPVVAGVVMAIVSYAFGLALLYVVALLINALAPKFDGQANLVQALKVTVYSATPVWVVSILTVIPMLGVLVLLAGIYSLALYWMGLPKLMKVPQEKKVGFNITVFLCVIVLYIVIGAVVSAIGGMFGTAIPPAMVPSAQP